MALAGEAGELLEIFQWLTPGESSDLDSQLLQHVGEELVDILQYVVRIADLLEIDLNDAFWAKFEENAARYPADEVRGKRGEALNSGSPLLGHGAHSIAGAVTRAMGVEAFRSRGERIKTVGLVGAQTSRQRDRSSAA